MIDLSNCYIVKVKTFLGLRSIDPPVAFDEFLEQNFNDLKSLIEKNQIIVIDDYGNEVDNLIWGEHIFNFYEKAGEKNPDQDSALYEANDSEEEIQEELERINKIDAEEKDKITHKIRLLKSLEHCNALDEAILEKGIERTDQKIKELQSERRAVLIRINQKING